MSSLLRRVAPMVSRSVAARHFGKFSRSEHKKLPLSSKRGNKHYNKGRGVPLEGRVTSKGMFLPVLTRIAY